MSPTAGARSTTRSASATARTSPWSCISGSTARATSRARFPEVSARTCAGHSGQSTATTSRAARATSSGSCSSRNATTAAKTRTTATTNSAATAAASALCGKNHLQQFIRIIEKVFELVALRSKHFRSQLRRDFCASYGRIFSDIANLVDLDAVVSSERGLQLFSKRSRLRVASGKCTHESRELLLCETRRKVNTRDAGGGKQLRETALCGGGAQRHTVQQNLLTRSAEQKTAVGALIESRTQLFPCCFKLRSGPYVTELVQTRELKQNVEAAHKLPRSCSGLATHIFSRGRPESLPRYLSQ